MWLTTSLITRKPAFLHYFWGKHNYQALFVSRPRTEFMLHFFSILVIILQFFYRPILQEKLHSFNIQDDRSTRFPCTTNYKNNIIKSNLYREFTIRWDCSVRSICHYVVRRVIMAFEQKLIYFNSIYKITRPSAKTYNASCQVFEWTLVMRKRSQNHFRLHFTSKTPYSFDTRGNLSTPTCDVHGRLKITISKVVWKIRSISWQTIKTKNIVQPNI